MNGRTLILLVIAIVVAVITVVVVRNHSGTASNSPKILVATSDISAGAFIHADKDIGWVDWPSNMSPAYLTQESHQIEEFNGAVARYPISAGVPITASAVVRPKEGGFMAAVLTPGLRAVSIPVSATTGNAGFVFPGDRVDLLLTHKIAGKEQGDSVLASETFIEDVRVLAIDQMLDNPENKAMVAKTITLEVSPKQAEMTNVAQSLGSISVSLRSLAADRMKSSAKETASPAAPVPGGPVSAAQSNNASATDSTFSTDNDVSKLMGNKNSVRSKVNVFHGNTSEQIDFHQGNK